MTWKELADMITSIGKQRDWPVVLIEDYDGPDQQSSHIKIVAPKKEALQKGRDKKSVRSRGGYSMTKVREGDTTWKKLAAKIRAMPPGQQDGDVTLVADGDEPNQRPIPLILVRAEHDIWDGISIGNEQVLCEGGYFLETITERHVLETVDTLVKELAAGDPETRFWAVAALEEFGPGAEKAVPALTESLQDPIPEVRMTAANTLACINPTEAAKVVPMLTEALQDPSPKARVMAASTLARINPTEAAQVVPMLMEALQDPNPEVRVMAANTLACINPTEAAKVVPVLTEGLSNERSDVKMFVLYRLLRMGELAVQAVPGLTGLLEQDQDARIRSYAAAILGAVGHLAEAAIPALRKAAKGDLDAEVRQAADDALKTVAPPGWRRHLKTKEQWLRGFNKSD
ncbi:MAG: HEAT repeat domain-containing protein [Planctomycetota bacterium]